MAELRPLYGIILIRRLRRPIRWSAIAVACIAMAAVAYASVVDLPAVAITGQLWPFLTLTILNTLWLGLFYDDNTGRVVRWILFDLSGVRAIREKVNPHATDHPPSPAPTFVLWLTGIYVAIFTIASQRYENRIDIIETRAQSMYSQLGTGEFRKALAEIPGIHLRISVKEATCFGFKVATHRSAATLVGLGWVSGFFASSFV